MSDQRPDLPRFSRDVRVTGAPAGPAGPWAGVGRPFGGVLDPGVPAGEWPPAGLSHLALGSLLADALRPASRPERRGRSDSVDDITPSDRSETSDESTEPTVREVIHEEGATAATRVAMDTPGSDDQREEVRLSTREPPTEPSGAPQRDAPSTPREATDSSGESADPTRRDDNLNARTGNRSASDVGVSRTVLRQAARGPAAPTTVADRSIAKLVEGRPRSPNTADTRFETGKTSRAVARQTADTGTGSWQASPVERTMPTVPPGLSGPAAASAAGSSGPPTPDVVSEQHPSMETRNASASVPAESATSAAGNVSGDLPGWRSQGGSAGGPSVEEPAMTVLQDDPAIADEGDSAAAASEPRQSQGGGTSAGGDSQQAAGGTTAPASVDGQPSPQTRAAGLAPSGDEAVSTLLEGMEPGGERAVQRTIENVVRQPRVIDGLYHEIQRRRRIERERGGDL